MSLFTEIGRIQNAKTSIKTAIENKGVEVGDGLIDTYASKIDKILASDEERLEIKDASYLFYNGARVDAMNELIKSISDDCISFSNMYYSCKTLTEFPSLNTGNGESFSNMYYSCNNCQYYPLIDTKNGKTFASMHAANTKIVESPAYNTSNGETFNSMFEYCNYIVTIPELDFGKANRVNSIFSNCLRLENIGGFKDLGKGYTQKSNNYSYYKLDLSVATKLTHDSLMNVINNLYDLNLSYDVANGGTLYTQQLVLGTTNMAKLTADEIAIATNKGWVVS